MSGRLDYRYEFNKNCGPIKSISDLCTKVLDISVNEFNQALSLPSEQRYEKAFVPKKDGSVRVVHNPHYLIRKIQRKINTRIFNPNVKKGTFAGVVKWPSYIFGCIPTQYRNNQRGEIIEDRRDYIACAKVHCLSKSILKIDISNFFDNIHRDTVSDIFEKFLDYPTNVSEALANICCNDESLVQGGLTSSYLAS